MSITLIAADCPSPQVPTGAIWIEDNGTSPYTTPHAETLGAGASVEIPGKWGRNAARIDVQGRLGAGAYGVANGLTLSGGIGLVVTVAAGQALLDGIVEKPTADTVELFANSTNWVWLKTDGTLEVHTDTNAPDVAAVLLGAAITDASSIVSLETSGVVKIVNGIPERETADFGMPTDSPPMSWRGWTKTLGGLFWWSGITYYALMRSGLIKLELPGDADYTLTAREASNRIIEISGTLTVSRTITLPLWAGAEYIVRNTTSHALEVKGATGSGVTVAAGKAATIYCDGTDYIRITADA